MQDVLQDYFKEASLHSKERMTECYWAEVTEFSRLTSLMMRRLSAFIANNPTPDHERPYHVAYALMTKGTNTLGAGLDLVLCGYHDEPTALHRVAIETFAVAWDLVHNPSRFNEWKKAKKFDSTLSISNVKEVFDGVGQLNGLLSKMGIHIGPLNSSPALFDRENPRIQLFGLIQPDKVQTRRPEVLFALFVAYICLQLVEITFHAYGDTLETIKMNDDKTSATNYVSDTHRPFVEAMKEVFTQMAAGSFEWA